VTAGKKKLLLVNRHPPYGTNLARAALDVALAAAAFEQEIALLFLDDGVWQLLPQQDAARIESKSIQRTLMSMPLYDIDTFYASARSLRERGLEPAGLLGNTVALEPEALAAFIEAHDQVLSF
jgi:tRNA 2-thiouridine synthesizing protein C